MSDDSVGCLAMVLILAIIVGGCCWSQSTFARREAELQQLRMAVEIYASLAGQR